MHCSGSQRRRKTNQFIAQVISQTRPSFVEVLRIEMLTKNKTPLQYSGSEVNLHMDFNLDAAKLRRLEIATNLGCQYFLQRDKTSHACLRLKPKICFAYDLPDFERRKSLVGAGLKV